MVVNITSSTENIAAKGLEIADKACNALNQVINDVSGDNKLNGAGLSAVNALVGSAVGGTPDITTAAGAMAIDKIIQDLTTSVQVASQILAATNKANQIVTRTLGS